MTPNKFRFACLAVALAALGGCKKDAPQPPPPELSVTLVEAGLEPRHPLRYSVAPETVVQSVLEVRTSATSTEDVEDTFGVLPGLRLELHAGPTLSLQDDVTRYVLRITRAFPVLPENTEIHHIEEVEAGVHALGGMRGRFDLSDRGIVLDSDVPWSVGQERIHPRVTIMLANVRSALATIPLPVEPVGMGASWEVRRTIRLWSARVTQVTRYALVDRADDRIRVKVTINQTAPAQIADLNPKLEMHVREYTMQGEGHALVDLGLPVAVEADLEAHSVADIALVSPEETEPISSSRHSVLRLTTESER